MNYAIDDPLAVELPNRICDAIVRCLKANVPLSEIVEGRIYRHNPESLDTFTEVNKIIVWPEPNLTNLNPQPGDYAHPTVSVVIMFITDTRTTPYVEGEVAPSDILTRCEMILELGTRDGAGDPYEIGRLVDPSVDPEDPLVPDTSKFLNRQRPEFQQRSKRVIPQSNTTAWPDLVTYKTTSTRMERRKA